MCRGVTSTKRSWERMTLCSTAWSWWMHFGWGDFRNGIVEWFELEGMLKITQCCVCTFEYLCLKGKGVERSLKKSKNMSRRGSWGTTSIKGLFCFSIIQAGSKLRMSLIPLQFPGTSSPRDSPKQFNEVINILL